MKARKRRRVVPLSAMMTELIFSSWETMARRSLLAAQGRCSPAEYRRMVLEKMTAARLSSLMLLRSRRKARMTSVLKPWHSRSTANAKRLRRK
jgi:hypothetical protein